MTRTERLLLWLAEGAMGLVVVTSASAIWTVLSRGWYFVGGFGILTVGIVLWVMVSLLPLLLRPNR